jgi:Tfp pilus assembly protein PilV
LIRKLLKEETGYSLIEVIVSILILAAAIIPMAGMFDMGLKAATKGGNYDGARALATANLEKVQALPYANAQANYRPVNDPPADPTRSVSCSQGIFTCNVKTTYVDNSFAPNSAATTKMQVEVTVQWPGGINYSTVGLKAK